MKTVLFVFAGLALLSVAAASGWGYDDSNGPDTWWREQAICRDGKEQSPINLINAVTDDTLTRLRFSYTGGCTSLNFVNNGHTWKVGFAASCIAAGMNRMLVGNTVYYLNQFHFHSAAEHARGGGLYDAELHMVHLTADNQKVAVLGTFLEGGRQTINDNTFMNTIYSAADVNANGASVDVTMSPGMDPYSEFTPPTPTYFTYPGSFTTPPCTEGVTWLLWEEPIMVDPLHLQIFRDSMKSAGIQHPLGDRRTVQPLHNRVIRYFNGRQPAGAGACFNEASDAQCYAWASYCSNPTYQSFMNRRCQATCSSGCPRMDCVNFESDAACAAAAAQGYCTNSQWSKWMLANCNKSCDSKCGGSGGSYSGSGPAMPPASPSYPPPTADPHAGGH